ncbi:hypothetical protein CAPTEDRAFT_202886 [Capitella teleta]|jgi:exosome complex exonuclease DIS3/RRP44|uniref:L1 transposable element RRM domain-containing protein n=1 Tax=Capitella teleta TaxID=283909 RepID=R7UQ06_CAPTE|nr:hypothetical protein CAPTEDRAFT_202886 [Capitella teleta]|eukprot:ELU08188.1 hypothetical protein CAPTEDRAFT_202886 [Capitella teleta]
MDLSSFVGALTSALQDTQVRACLSDIVGESFRQELISLKAELKKKDSVIEHLDRRIESLESQNDALEQYTRRNSIRVTGLPEVEHEDILDRTLKIVNEDLEVNPPISIMDIDRVHRVGRRNPDRPRSVIVKFSTYRARQSVMKMKKNIKTRLPSTFLNEDLTKERSTFLYKARQMKRQKQITDCWTHDGAIVFKDNNGKIHSGRTLWDCENLLASFVKS